MSEELNLPVISGDVVVEDKQPVLHVINYESVKTTLEATLDTCKVFLISNDEDKKLAKEKRAALNNALDAIKRKRIDSLKALCGAYEGEMKALESLLDARQKEFGAAIKEYEESVVTEATATGTINKPKAMTITVKTYDPKVIEKIRKIALDNNCEITIK